MDFLLVHQPLFNLLLINAGFALSQYVVLRCGVFSLATAGIVSIGAYVSALAITSLHVSIWWAAPLGALAGLAAGLLLSVPLARLRGPYQAVATLAFVQIVVAFANYADALTGGPLGINNIPREVSTAGLLSCVALTVYLLGSMNATRLGCVFDALRQDEAVPGSLGISIARHHALAFALSGAIAGLFGALQAGYTYAIEPHQYGFPLLTMTLAAVILGGRRSVWGPIAGAAIMTLLPELARPLADNRLLVNGALLILIAIFLPRGVVDEALHLHRQRRRRLASGVGVQLSRAGSRAA